MPTASWCSGAAASPAKCLGRRRRRIASCIWRAEPMATSDAPAKRPHFALGDFLARYGIVLSFVILFVALALANKNFLSTVNILNVLRQVSINGILAIGMTFVILTGGIDLSI